MFITPAVRLLYTVRVQNALFLLSLIMTFDTRSRIVLPLWIEEHPYDRLTGQDTTSGLDIIISVS